MPTYEYICSACSAHVDFFQSISAAPKRKCPECGALKLKRQISAGAGILFKGNGFYTTDYRSDSYKAAQRAEKNSLNGTAAKSDSSKSEKKIDTPVKKSSPSD